MKKNIVISSEKEAVKESKMYYMVVYRPVGSKCWTPLHHSKGNVFSHTDWHSSKKEAQKIVDAITKLGLQEYKVASVEI